jgi:ABC-2 type transport system ATP-binding protein
VSGPDLSTLTRKLRHLPGVEQAVAFGNTLHVSGADAVLLEQTIAPFRTADYQWKKERSGLEDVFIHLMHSSQKKPGV